MKYQVTNVSAHSEKGARSVFLTEAGRLLKPGEAAPCNRIDNGTWGLEKAGLLKIEEGNFAPTPIFKAEPPKADPDVEEPTAPKAEDIAKRKADQAEMDKRIAAAKAEEDAKAAAKAAESKKSDKKSEAKSDKKSEAKSEGAKASEVPFSDSDKT